MSAALFFKKTIYTYAITAAQKYYRHTQIIAVFRMNVCLANSK